MALGERLPQLWKKIKELTETKLDKSGGTVTGTINSTTPYIIRANNNMSLYAGGDTIGLTSFDNSWITYYQKDIDKFHITRNLEVYGGARFTGDIIMPTYSKLRGTSLVKSEFHILDSNMTLRALWGWYDNYAKFGLSGGSEARFCTDKITTNKPIEMEGINLKEELEKKVNKNTVNYTTMPISIQMDNLNEEIGTKIKLPFDITSSKMVTFTVRVYQYYQYCDIQFSGYLYSTMEQWYLPNAIMLGGTNGLNISVKMGKDSDNKAYVWVQGGNYRGISVLNVTSGYIPADWNNGWEIEITNETPNIGHEVILVPPFNQFNCPVQKSENGYTKLANGIIIQWGTTAKSKTWNNGTYSDAIVFPLAFTSTPSVSIAGMNFSGSVMPQITILSETNTHFQLYKDATSSTTILTYYVRWIAIGY